MTNEEHLLEFIKHHRVLDKFIEGLKNETNLTTYFGTTGVKNIMEGVNLCFKWPSEDYMMWSSLNGKWRRYVIANGLSNDINMAKFIELVEPKITNEAIFRLFLKKYRVLMKYRRSRKEYTLETECSNSTTMCHAIMDAFSWINAEECETSWSVLHVKWLEMCNDMKLSGTIKPDEV